MTQCRHTCYTYCTVAFAFRTGSRQGPLPQQVLRQLQHCLRRPCSRLVIYVSCQSLLVSITYDLRLWLSSAACQAGRLQHDACYCRYYMHTAAPRPGVVRLQGCSNPSQLAFCAMLCVLQDPQQCGHVQNLKLKAGRRAEQHQMTQERRQTFQQKVCSQSVFCLLSCFCNMYSMLRCGAALYRLSRPQEENGLLCTCIVAACS